MKERIPIYMEGGSRPEKPATFNVATNIPHSPTKISYQYLRFPSNCRLFYTILPRAPRPLSSCLGTLCHCNLGLVPRGMRRDRGCNAPTARL